MADAIDPTRVRMSVAGDVLLSEFVGNESVYTRGLANPVQTDAFLSTVRGNASALAGLIGAVRAADPPEGITPGNWCVAGDLRFFTISYGYIHPRLSEAIVKWKPGDLPSLHRWDDGAACDIQFHSATFVPYMLGLIDEGFEPHRRTSPLHLATWFNTHGTIGPMLERTITYSESPYICISTRSGSTPSRKWYENRFTGEVGMKPTYLQHQTRYGNYQSGPWRDLWCDWRGCGYPTYHGGGGQRSHHIRTSAFTMASTWLYNRNKVHYGQSNRIPQQRRRKAAILKMMTSAGEAYDRLACVMPDNMHLPVISGIDIKNRTSDWEQDRRWSFVIAGSYPYLYDLVRTVMSNHPETRILDVVALADRAYISPETGRPIGPDRAQQRVQVIGEPYDVSTDLAPFTRGPTFCQRAAGGSSQRRPESGGVDEVRPRTRRRGSDSISRLRRSTRL